MSDLRVKYYIIAKVGNLKSVFCIYVIDFSALLRKRVSFLVNWEIFSTDWFYGVQHIFSLFFISESKTNRTAIEIESLKLWSNLSIIPRLTLYLLSKTIKKLALKCNLKSVKIIKSKLKAMCYLKKKYGSVESTSNARIPKSFVHLVEVF